MGTLVFAGVVVMSLLVPDMMCCQWEGYTRSPPVICLPLEEHRYFQAHFELEQVVILVGLLALRAQGSVLA